MDVLRVVDAFCASCSDVRSHAVMTDDPSSCFCNRCGTCQTLVAPLAETTMEEGMERLTERRPGSRPGRGEIWFSDRSNQSDSSALAAEGHPSRHDVWTHGAIMGGVALLSEAMQIQDNPETMRLLADQIAQNLDIVRQRHPKAEASVEEPIQTSVSLL